MKIRWPTSGIISSYVPQIIKRSRNGRVHSQFRNSFNIRFEEDLININRINDQLSSFGINLFPNFIENIISTTKVDDIVVIHEEKIIIYGSFGDIHVIETKKLKCVDLRLRCIEMSENRVHSIFYSISGLIHEKHLDLAYIDPDVTKCINFMISSEEPVKYFESLAGLVGRGVGLTPSGDDVLFGYFLIRTLFSQESALNERFLNYFSQNTNDISSAYLKSLKEGYISEYFQLFCDAILEEDRNGLISAIEKIKMIGHTSGYDTMVGIIIGLKSLIAEIVGIQNAC